VISPVIALTVAGAVLVSVALGAFAAWAMRHYSTLSARNFYLPAAVAALALAFVLALRAWSAVTILAPISSFTVSAAAYGRRHRLADLGAGEELRSYEQARR